MRAFFHYVPLVGLPLLGVSLVLRTGASTVAAPSVGGEWTLVPSAALLASRCAANFGLGSASVLSVSQSGDRLLLSLNDRWRGVPARVRRLGADSAEIVADTDHLGFSGTVDRRATPQQMQFRISWPDCSGSVTVAGIATRGRR